MLHPLGTFSISTSYIETQKLIKLGGFDKVFN